MVSVERNGYDDLSSKLDEAAFHSALNLWERYKSNYSPSRYA